MASFQSLASNMYVMDNFPYGDLTTPQAFMDDAIAVEIPLAAIAPDSAQVWYISKILVAQQRCHEIAAREAADYSQYVENATLQLAQNDKNYVRKIFFPKDLKAENDSTAEWREFAKQLSARYQAEAKAWEPLIALTQAAHEMITRKDGTADAKTWTPSSLPVRTDSSDYPTDRLLNLIQDRLDGLGEKPQQEILDDGRTVKLLVPAYTLTPATEFDINRAQPVFREIDPKALLSLTNS